MLRQEFADVFKRLIDARWLTEERIAKGLDGLVQEALFGGEPSLMEGAQFMNIIEYGRAVGQVPVFL
jgi:hypothetical protein